MKRLDLIANVAVIVTSIAMLGFLGSSWYQGHHVPLSSAARAHALVGTTIQLPGVDFKQRDKTLLIAISENCHFCQESQPFYRQLANAPNIKTSLVAVLPRAEPGAGN